MTQQDPGGWLFSEWKPGGRLHSETFATVGELIERIAAYAAIEEWQPAESAN